MDYLQLNGATDAYELASYFQVNRTYIRRVLRDPVKRGHVVVCVTGKKHCYSMSQAPVQHIVGSPHAPGYRWGLVSYFYSSLEGGPSIRKGGNRPTCIGLPWFAGLRNKVNRSYSLASKGAREDVLKAFLREEEKDEATA